MSIQMSVQIEAPKESVLNCAYDTLVSMKCKEHRLDNNYISHNLSFAFVKGAFKLPNYLVSEKYIVSVSVENISDNQCKLTVTSSAVLGTSLDGYIFTDDECMTIINQLFVNIDMALFNT